LLANVKRKFTLFDLISTEIVIDDGNGILFTSQENLCTDFPLDEIKLYGC